MIGLVIACAVCALIAIFAGATAMVFARRCVLAEALAMDRAKIATFVTELASNTSEVEARVALEWAAKVVAEGWYQLPNINAKLPPVPAGVERRGARRGESVSSPASARAISGRSHAGSRR